jgi:hypothetical protein
MKGCFFDEEELEALTDRGLERRPEHDDGRGPSVEAAL